MGYYWDIIGILLGYYPLVNIQKAMENGHRNSGFSHEQWWIFPLLFVCSPEGNEYDRVEFFGYPPAN